MYFLKNFDNDLDLFDDFSRMFSKSTFMASDLVEKENEYELTVSVPGVDKKDISISYHNGYLTIGVNQKSENKGDKKSHQIVRERVYRNAGRSFYVGSVDENKLGAKLNDGILTIVVPKEQAQAKKLIEIE